MVHFHFHLHFREKVAHGSECGLALGDFQEFQEGDEIECMKTVWKTRTLNLLDAPSGVIVDPNQKKKNTKAMDSSSKKQYFL
jgi:hypothetical protein